MRNTRGFKLVHKLVKIFKWKIAQRIQHGFQLGPPTQNFNLMSKFFGFARSLRRRAKRLCSYKPGYIQLGQERVESKVLKAPKGQLAVYVGESEDEAKRYLVPVIYFNHPMFGELLKGAEKVYGYDHPGGITIPCEASEFEKVKKNIAASEGCRRRNWRQRRYWMQKQRQ